MNAEFNWWLLIVGLVAGAGLVWFVLMDARRRDVDVEAEERRREAAWLAVTLSDEGWDVPPDAAARMLELHRAYLDAPPPDAVDDRAAAASSDITSPVEADPGRHDDGLISAATTEPDRPDDVKPARRRRTRVAASTTVTTSEGPEQDGVGGGV